MLAVFKRSTCVFSAYTANLQQECFGDLAPASHYEVLPGVCSTSIWVVASYNEHRTNFRCFSIHLPSLREPSCVALDWTL